MIPALASYLIAASMFSHTSPHLYCPPADPSFSPWTITPAGATAKVYRDKCATAPLGADEFNFNVPPGLYTVTVTVIASATSPVAIDVRGLHNEGGVLLCDFLQHLTLKGTPSTYSFVGVQPVDADDINDPAFGATLMASTPADGSCLIAHVIISLTPGTP